MVKSFYRNSYAIKHCVYAGEILVFIKEAHDSYEFLSVPKMVNRSIPLDKFKYGWDNGIIDFVEAIPKDVYNIVTAQFEKNCKSIK